MSADPDEMLYYSRQQLAEKAGVSHSTFKVHESLDVGSLSKAKEIIAGIGIVYVGHKCRKYLALTATTASRRKKKTPTQIPAEA